MYLVVREPTLRETRWYGLPRRGTLAVGVAPEGDVQLSGHNLAARHVVLAIRGRGRVVIEPRRAWGVQLNARPPREGAVLAAGDVLTVGTWELSLEEPPPAPRAPVDDAFLGTTDDDERLVHADALEERGLLAEAELVRATIDPPEQHRIAELALRTPPAFRRRLFGLPIEACKPPEHEACPGRWRDLPGDEDADERSCPTCSRRVVLCGDLGSARQHALAGRPVVLDPAVRRWPDDLREPARKRLVIEMGRPSGR